MPFFIYAKVTDCTGAAELEEMISNVGINVGEMYLDREFSRANAQLIADIGAVPYIAIKRNIKPRSYGYPAWNRMECNIPGILHGMKEKNNWLLANAMVHKKQIKGQTIV